MDFFQPNIIICCFRQHYDCKCRYAFNIHLIIGFIYFIECFTTTFLRAHSWINWVDEDDDEDEVGLKEKPEDTRYIKKITSK